MCCCHFWKEMRLHNDVLIWHLDLNLYTYQGVCRNADLLQSQRFIWQFDDLLFRVEYRWRTTKTRDRTTPYVSSPFEIKDLSRDAMEATHFQAQNKRDIETSTPSTIMKYLKTHRFLWNVASKIWIDRAVMHEVGGGGVPPLESCSSLF